MSEKNYASLHAHSDFSNLKIIDSINKVKDLLDNAYEKGLHAIALTDHDTVSGHIKAIQHFNAKYKEKGDFKLILGNEIYLTKEGMNSETYEKGDKFYHLLLLAKNAAGHEQIRQLSSRAWKRSFIRGIMRTPTYGSDLVEIVGSNPGNLISTTACLGGVTGSFFTERGAEAFEDIAAHLERMESVFGKGNFFIEVQPSMNIEQVEYNKFMVEKFWGQYPFIFTTDAHFADVEDRETHAMFLQSASSGDREVEKFYSSAYIMRTDEIFGFLSYLGQDKLEEMRLNTIRIADMCEIYDLKHPQLVPTVEIDLTIEARLKLVELEQFIPKKYTYIHKYLTSLDDQDLYFTYKVFEGFKSKIDSWTDEYLERFDNEFEQLWETSLHIKQPLSKYFVTMSKMIDIMWNEGDSLVGVSRGSAAGFLTNYCLNITQLDPLRQELEMPYWRFIHKDRPELPDIDIDTEGSKRVRVFNKVQEYFNSIGGDLINVCTFGTEKSKSAIRTAGRSLNIDDDVLSFVVSLIPNERGFDWTLDQCMYGDEDHVAIKKFQEVMGKEKALWKLAYSIEGLITRLGVHASGVIAFNNDFTKHNSIMKTNSGALVSAFNLEDTEYAGGLKYDFLTVNALDKIRTTMNLLLEDGVIDWVGNLKGTYDKYLLPKQLDYKNKEMWEMASTGQIVDLFQFDTLVGAQAMKSIKPQSISELAIANSLMRLMAQEDGGELPLETYVKFKNTNRLWYDEMKNAGLNDKEISILEKYLKPLSGVADSQESVMMIVMDKNISGFNVLEANALRKAIAKKKFDVLEKVKKMFYEKGASNGARKFLLDYVWNTQIMRQAGYSFSVLHTMGYSTIALQEMNLAYNFPVIYWNTACLSVNAGAVNDEDFEALIDDGIIELEEDDENKRDGSKVQYGKVAAAIEKFRTELGMNIQLPDINRAKFGFTPDADKNVVLFGLKGITRIGEDLIREIIAHRPYASLEDFINKMNSGEGKKLISKDRVILLIKAGAFDKIDDRSREEILRSYIESVTDKKERLTLQNMNMLIENNLIPDELDFEKRVYKFTKYIRKQKHQNLYLLDSIAQEFYFENNFDQSKLTQAQKFEDVYMAVPQTYWDSIYEKFMEKVRNYIKNNSKELLNKLNKSLFDEEWNKYATGNLLQWELESLNFYHSGHELKDIAATFPIEISNVRDIPEEEVIGVFTIKDKVFPKYQIRHIIGTVLDKDKQKHTVTLSTPDGVITLKVYRNSFAKYDQTLSETVDGEKRIIQESFFKKGTFLLVSGIKRGDTFVPKVYKDLDIDPIIMFEIADGKFKKGYEKI